MSRGKIGSDWAPVQMSQMTSTHETGKRQRLKRGTLLAVGGIQIFDFVSDLAVMIQWYAQKEDTLANAGTACLVVAVLVAAVGGSYYLFDSTGPCSGYSLPVKILLLLVLPLFNLHLIFVGFTMDGKNSGQRTFFFLGKLYATLYESLPMAILMIYYICITDPHLERETTLLIMLPSLSLSCLSMAYGGAGGALNEAQTTSVAAGFRTFSYFVVDIIWLLSGIWGLFVTGQFIVLAYVLGLQFVGVLCLYVKLYPIFKEWHLVHLLFFYLLQVRACVLVRCVRICRVSFRMN
jgi:hypothetical protein